MRLVSSKMQDFAEHNGNLVRAFFVLILMQVDTTARLRVFICQIEEPG